MQNLWMYTYCLTPGRKMPPTSLKKTIVRVCALEASSVHTLTSCHDILTCLQFIAERISPFSRWFWKHLSCVNTSFMSEGGTRLYCAFLRSVINVRFTTIQKQWKWANLHIWESSLLNINFLPTVSHSYLHFVSKKPPPVFNLLHDNWICPLLHSASS